jgi:hypothetical protein
LFLGLRGDRLSGFAVTDFVSSGFAVTDFVSCFQTGHRPRTFDVRTYKRGWSRGVDRNQKASLTTRRMTIENKKPSLTPRSNLVRDSGVMPFRIVTRDLGDQRRPYRGIRARQGALVSPGRLLPQTQRRCDCPGVHAAALCKAWTRFEERARCSLRMDPPPAK